MRGERAKEKCGVAGGRVAHLATKVQLMLGADMESTQASTPSLTLMRLVALNL